MPERSDATVTVSIQGEDTLVRAAEKVGQAWRNAAQQITASGQEMQRNVVSAFTGVATELVGIATAAGAIDFKRGAEEARLYGLALTRAALSSGQAVGDLGAKLAHISRQTLTPEPELLRMRTALRGITYDAGFSTDSLEAIHDRAEDIGRSDEYVLQLAGVLQSTYGVSENVRKSFGDIEAVAKQLGGTDAFQKLADQIQGVDAVASHFKSTTKEMSALLGTLGEGRTPAQQKEIQAGVLGSLARDRFGWEIAMRGHGLLRKGESLVNERGEIADEIGAVGKLRELYIREAHGNVAAARRHIMFNMGDVIGAGVMDFDEKKARARQAADAAAQADVAAKVLASPEGQQTATMLEQQRSQRAGGGAVARTVQPFSAFLAENPVTGYMIKTAADVVTGPLSGRAALGALGALKLLGITGLAGPALAIAAGSAATTAGLSYLDYKTGLTDWIANSVGDGVQVGPKGQGRWTADPANDPTHFTNEEYRRLTGQEQHEDRFASKIAQHMVAALWAGPPQQPPPVHVTVEQADGPPQKVKHAKRGARHVGLIE